MISADTKRLLLAATEEAYEVGTSEGSQLSSTLADVGYVIEESIDVTETGFKALALRRDSPTGSERIVAFAGTEDARDAVADLDLGLPQWTESIRERIVAYVREHAMEGPIHFTGHSLGGVLAQYAVHDVKVATRSAAEPFELAASLTTFNAVGAISGLQSRETRGGSPFDPDVLVAESAAGDVAHYFVEGDMVSRLGDGHLGGSTYMLTRTPGVTVAALFPELPPLLAPAPLDLVNAHGVATILTIVQESDGFQGNVQVTPEYLHVHELHVKSTLISSLGKVDRAVGEEEAQARLTAAVAGTLALLKDRGDDDALVGEVRAVLGALFDNVVASFGEPESASLRAAKGWLEMVRGVQWVTLARRSPVIADYLGELSVESLLESILGASFDPESGTVTPAGATQSAEAVVQYLQLSGADLGDVRDALRERLKSRFLEGRYFQQQGAKEYNVDLDDVLVVGESVFGKSFGILEAVFGKIGLLTGGEGRDILIGGRDGEMLNGGGNADFVFGERGEDSLVGGPGEDVLYGGAGDDSHEGGADDDELHGGAGDDVLKGGTGDDLLEGGLNNDLLFGGAGDDTLIGGTAEDGDDHARDRVEGGDGYDIYEVGDRDLVWDSDHSGEVRLHGSVVSGSFVEISDRVYSEEKSGYTARWVDADGDGSIDDIELAGEGVTFAILDFSSGDLGISLVETGEPAVPTSEETSGPPPASETAVGTEDNDFLLSDGLGTRVEGRGGQDQFTGATADDDFHGGDGDDLANGGVGRDRLYGDAGKDILFGQGDDDRLEGGTGDDVLSGQEGDDYGEGGDGSDVMGGGSGDDWLLGGEGDDLIHGDFNFDVVLDLSVYTTSGAEFGEDAWKVEFIRDAFLRPVDQVLGNIVALSDAEALPGDDLLLAGPGNDRVIGGGGHDVMFGDAGNDVLEGEDGDDTLYGGTGEDLLIGGAGDDRLDGGTGVDELQGGDGQDMLSGGDADDRLFGGGGADTLSGGAGVDLLLGDRGADTLHGGDGNDTLRGGDAGDALWGGPGDDLLEGQAGDDSYHFRPGDGADLIFDAEGTNRVVLEDGVTSYDVTPGLDRDASSGDARVQLRYGAADVVTYAPGDIDEIELSDGRIFDAAQALAQAMANFYGQSRPHDTRSGTAAADVISGDAASNAIMAAAGGDQLSGAGGDDLLLGEDGEDMLEGGPGDDLLLGGAGFDTYRFDRGGGRDRIADAGANRLEFGTGVAADGLAVEQHIRADGGLADVLIVGDSSGDAVSVTSAASPGLTIAFADGGAETTVAALLAMQSTHTLRNESAEAIADTDKDDEIFAGPAAVVTANYGADIVHGGDVDNVIAGGVGNDVLFGNGGDDFLDGEDHNDDLYGGTGDDTLEGGGGGDLLAGGTGDDVLAGGDGQDRYLFGLGDGQDVIRDTARLTSGSIYTAGRLWSGGGESNLIAFEPGVTAASVSVELIPGDTGAVTGDWPRIPASYRVHYGDAGDTILLEDYLAQASLEENLPSFEFADGSLERFHFNGATGIGTSGSDYFKGTAGADDIRAGAGDDVVYGWFYTNFQGMESLSGDYDTIDTGTGNDVIFARGDILGGDGDDHIEGAGLIDAGPGDDSVVSLGDSRHLIAAGAGSDRIRNVAGIDVVEFGAGIAPGDIAGSRVGDDLVFSTGAGGRVTIESWFERQIVQRFEFSDGTVLSSPELEAQVLTGSPVVVNHAPAVSSALPDRVESEGSFLSMSLPADTFAEPDSWDWLSYEVTLASGAPLPAWLSVTPGAYGSNGATQGFWLSGTPLSADTGNYDVRVTATDTLGASATDVFQLTVNPLQPVVGTAGDDVLYGTVSDDLFDGGPGNDALYGVQGDDTYLVHAGDSGIDRIGGGGVTDEHDDGYDTVRVENVSPGDVSYYYSTSSDFFGGGIHLRWGADGSRGLDLFLTDVEHIVLGGTAMEAADLFDRVEMKLDPGTGNYWAQPNAAGGVDVQVNSAFTSYAFGSPGDDRLTGDAPDTIFLHRGRNVMFGFDGDDVLAGGPGADYLNGGAGDDTYLYRSGDGPDVISDGGGAGDVLVLGSGVTLPGVSLTAAGDDLVLSLGTSTTLTAAGFTEGGMAPATLYLPDDVILRGWYSDPQRRVETLRFEDGGSYALGDLAPERPLGVTAPLPDQTASEDAPFSLTVPADVFSIRGSELMYAATLADGSVLPGWLDFDPLTATFSGIPRNDDVGEYEILLRAVDGSGTSVTDVFLLEVQNTNDPPLAGPALPDQEAFDGLPFVFDLPAESFVDVDAGDRLVYAAGLDGGTALPAWLSFDDATVSFSGTPDDADVGEWPVRIAATDTAGSEVATGFMLTVTDVNDPPVPGVALDDAVALEDSAFEYVLPPGAFTDEDAGDVLTLDAATAAGAPLPGWLRFDPAAGLFTGVPGSIDVGATTVVVSATDTAGETARSEFVLSVLGVNHPPVVGLGFGDHSVAEDTAFNQTVPYGVFLDPDAGDVLRYEVTGAGGGLLPAWLEFDTESAAFSGTPGNADVGETRVVVTATDLSGASISDSFRLTVTNVNDAPSLAGMLADQTVDAGAAFSYVLPEGLFEDVDAADMVSLTAAGSGGDALPAWLGFDSASATFSGIPTAADVGSMAVEVRATDVAGASASTSFSITVRDVPVWTMIGSDSSERMYGTYGEDAMYGGAGDDWMVAWEGDDTLRGGPGRDELFGYVGDDTFVFGRGDDEDKIRDYRDDGNDRVVFDSDIVHDQLWFSRYKNDLRVSIIGTGDSVRVKYWFESIPKPVRSFETADGALLLDSQVQQLVDAMAAFSPPPAGQLTLPEALRSELEPVIAASWTGSG